MRVLVTGHHRYIGSVTSRALAHAGHDIVGLDTFLYEGCDFGSEDGPFPELRRDIRDVSRGEAGAHELANAYRADEMTSEEFEGSRYTRLKRLQEALEARTLDRELRRSVAV